MRLGINASNIRAGGSVTHLVELLRAADRLAYGFSQVIVWGGEATLENGNRRCSALSLGVSRSISRKNVSHSRWRW